ncbi:MAG: hypothetical protein AAFX50_19510 [Acidobacteriota bacterium]
MISHRRSTWWLSSLVFALAAAPLAGEAIDFCQDPSPAPRVDERVVRFELDRDVFSRFAQEPAAVKHNEVAELRLRLEVAGGEASALRFTGSPADGGEARRLCDPTVEEAPGCDSSPTPISDAWVSNRDELSPGCLDKLDLSKLLCVRELESHQALIKVSNFQTCRQKVRVGFLLTVKSTATVEVGGQVFARQFQTPDPTVILEPAGGPGSSPGARP